MKHLLSHSVVVKVLVLLALLLLATLPLSQVAGLIQERGNSRTEATQALAGAHAGPQVIAGPFLVVPYLERWMEEKRDDKGHPLPSVQRSATRYHVVHPERATLQGRLTPQERYRGIFTVLFYGLAGSIGGQFAPFDPASLPRTVKDSTLEPPLAPVLAFALSDIRGLQGAPKLELAGAPGRWQPRVPGLPSEHWLAQGIHAPLPPAALAAWEARQPLPFRLDLTMIGQHRLAMVPLADETTAALSSPWPHPGFGGEFLALRRTVSDQGFEARWSVSSLVSTARSQLMAPVRGSNPLQYLAAEQLDSFDVSLTQPLDVYTLSNRAVKYGLLFVALVLFAAFSFELFRQLRLHPVQYGLVGISITLFFLLLLALSEKMPFGLAYAAAATASVLLLTVYFSAVLQGWRRGLGLGALVAALYGALYGLLLSEDNALLLGALLLFGLLGLLMLATRKVDWYRLSAPPPATDAST